MKNTPVAFWIWNKRESRMSLTPARVASGKASFNQPLFHIVKAVNLFEAHEAVATAANALMNTPMNGAAYCEESDRLIDALAALATLREKEGV